MPSTYVSIGTTSLTSTTDTVTFSSIPNTYTDLVLIAQVSTAHSNNGARLYMQFNTDTSTSNTNYSNHFMRGDGTTASASKDTGQPHIAYGQAGNSTDNFNTMIVNIMNYSNSSTYKTILSKSANTSTEANGSLRWTAGMWQNTNAITTITLTCDTGGHRANSTFTLYGIKAA